MLINNNEYLDIVETIKLEIKSAQYKAAVSVANSFAIFPIQIAQTKLNTDRITEINDNIFE